MDCSSLSPHAGLWYAYGGPLGLLVALRLKQRTEYDLELLCLPHAKMTRGTRYATMRLLDVPGEARRRQKLQS